MVASLRIALPKNLRWASALPGAAAARAGFFYALFKKSLSGVRQRVYWHGDVKSNRFWLECTIRDI
jgi:hypothetical protein